MEKHDFREMLKYFREQQEKETKNRNAVFALERMKISAVGKCEKCGRTELLTYDHVVPHSILAQLGVAFEFEFDEDNGQVLCRLCNQFKANRLDFTHPKTKEILLKYINRL